MCVQILTLNKGFVRITYSNRLQHSTALIYEQIPTLRNSLLPQASEQISGYQIFLDYNGYGGDKILQMLVIVCQSTRRHNPEDLNFTNITVKIFR